MTGQAREFLLVPGESFLEVRGVRDGKWKLFRTFIRSVQVRGQGRVGGMEATQAQTVEGESSGLGSSIARARDA